MEKLLSRNEAWPRVVTIAQVFLGVLLLVSGLLKLAELNFWAEALRLHAGASPLVAAAASRALTALEIATGLLLLIGRGRRVALPAVFMLAAVYIASVGYVLLSSAGALPWAYGGAPLQDWPLGFQGMVAAGVALLACGAASRRQFQTITTTHSRWVVAGVGVAALVMLASSSVTATATGAGEQATQRKFVLPDKPMPLLNATSTSDEMTRRVRLKALMKQSKWSVLLFFQSTDCFSCISYIPSLRRAVDRAKRKGVKVQLIGVALHTSAQEMDRFLASAELPVPILIAPSKKKAPAFFESISFYETPFFALIGENHRIRHSRVFAPGAQPTSEEYAAMFEHLQ